MTFLRTECLYRSAHESSRAVRLALRRHAIVSAISTAKRDSMRPTIGTARTRYRQTSRVWAPATVTIEAAHITTTLPPRVENPLPPRPPTAPTLTIPPLTTPPATPL